MAMLWNQPRSPSTYEENVVYIFTMEYYSALKKNEIRSSARKWM
jgi:hypothetical protein